MTKKFKGNTRNNQEIFDYVLQMFVMLEMPRSVTPKGICSYDPAGLNTIGCAVGCLISKRSRKKWDKVFLSGIKNIMKESPQEYHKFFDLSQIEFLRQIQKFHDMFLEHGCKNPKVFDEILDISKVFNLTIPEQVKEKYNEI